MIAGSKGYTDDAGDLVKRYEKISFAEKHAAVLHLLPTRPCSVLDIGAGSGADAAWFAAGGNRVVAVEPTHELRVAGMALHPSTHVEWVDDSLPHLVTTLKRDQVFDVVMMTAVWMHLDEAERREGMPNVAALLRRGGLLVMSLRHGPPVPTRRMFDVSAEETIELAQAHRLRSILTVRRQSIQPVNRQAGVTWSHLAFTSEGASELE